MGIVPGFGVAGEWVGWLCWGFGGCGHMMSKLGMPTVDSTQS
jgi:hypothetical protein